MSRYHLRSVRSAACAAAVFVFAVAPPARALELEPSYVPDYATAAPYPSRWQAERDIFNAPGWPGSELARPAYTEDQAYGSRTAYAVEPEYLPKSPFFSPTYYLTDGVPGCDDCPLHDAYGNPRCAAGQRQYCASEAAITAAIHRQFDSGAYCDWYVESESPWAFSAFTGAGPALPDGTQTYGVAHHKTHTVRYWQKQYNCLTPPAEYGTWRWRSRADSWTACPTGYYDAGTIPASGVASCSNHFFAWLREYTAAGVEPAEPAPERCPVGNPCHPTSGNKSLSEADFSAPTLSLTRAWNAMLRYRDYAAMGRGWTHNYSQRLLDKPGAPVPTRKLLDGRGSVEHFECTDPPACSLYRSLKTPGWLLRPAADGGWEVLSPGGERRRFDRRDRLVGIERRGGAYSRVTVSYDGNDRVQQAVDQSGRSLVFHYNADGLVGSVTLPSGASIGYRYERPAGVPAHVAWQQRLAKVIREDLSERSYHYEDRGADGSPRFEFLVTGISDENGSRFASYSYDDHARARSSERAGGAGRVVLNYTRRPGEDGAWTATEVTGPLGGVVTYTMEPGPFRQPTGLIDRRGTLAVRYDPATGWPSQRTDRAGRQTTYAYADGLHLTRLTEAAGTPQERVVETDWDSTVNRVRERREAGRTTTYTHNQRGQVLTRTETAPDAPSGRTWTYRYHEAPAIAELVGRLKEVDGPRSDVPDITSYEYYTRDDPAGAYLKGDLHTVRNALGHVTEYLAYDGDGRPLRVRDPNGVVTTVRYDARGRVESHRIDGDATLFAYDGAGSLIRVTRPDGSHVAYEYDGAHRLVAVADHSGNRVEYTLDAAGNRVAEETYDDRGILRRRLARVYDEFSRLRKVIGGHLQETGYGYDADGRLGSVLDPGLNLTRFEHDPLGRLARTIDAALGESVTRYDAGGQLDSVSDPLGNLTRYAYDGLGQLTALDSPDSGLAGFEYDGAGNRTAATDARGVRVEYVYDALDRLRSVRYPDDGLDAGFSYDEGANGKGRLTGMTDAAGSEAYAYDARGRLTGVVRLNGASRYATGYAYDGSGHLRRISYPSGMVVDYALDAAGRVSAVHKTVGPVTENLVEGVVYEPFGPVKSFTYGNGLPMEAVYGPDFELRRLRSGPGIDWAFDYDAAGNLLAISDRGEPAGGLAFAYDELHRLVAAAGEFGREGFAYDANGNRTRRFSDVAEDVYGYATGSNRLATQNGWLLDRDASGNRRGRLGEAGHGQLYDYGDHNRLSRVVRRTPAGDALAGAYGYDGRGQRVRKQAGGAVTHFVYGLRGELLGEYAGDGSALSEYVYLDGRPIAQVSRRRPETPAEGAERTVDNDAAGTGSSGAWRTRRDPQQYGADYREAGKKPGSRYRWTTTPPGAAYEVYAWWVANKNYASEVEYTIGYGDGETDRVRRSHQTGGGQWQLLGRYPSTGGPGFVELSAANGKASADAVKWVAVGGPGGAAPATAFIHGDHLGTPRAVTDAAGTVVWRWPVTPFGDAAPDEDPDGDGAAFRLNLRFPGQYYDAESGLHYNHFRDYDADIGRYVESDPIGLDGGLNTFAYVGSNPLRRTDPLGLAQMCQRDLLLPIPYARHCYARFGDGSTSSFGPSGVHPDPDPDQQGTLCTAPEQPEKDDCVKRAMQNCRGQDYHFTRFNCCHCVEQAMKACGIAIPPDQWPNWPVNPGPQVGEPGYDPLPVYGPALGDLP